MTQALIGMAIGIAAGIVAVLLLITRPGPKGDDPESGA